MIEIDARGFDYPIPVVKTKKTIEKNPREPITIFLEIAAAKENVSVLPQQENIR